MSVLHTECADGIVAGTETCDDNTDDEYGCNSTCDGVTNGFDCDSASPSVCTTTCGDKMFLGDEECDDGNLNSGDGCSDICETEPGYN